MTDRRKKLLGKLVPEYVDLIENSSGKRALRKSKNKLFGNKFRKLLAKDSKTKPSDLQKLKKRL